MPPWIIDLGLGAWLVLSAQLWGHTRPELDNTWIVGGLIIISSIAWGAGWAHGRRVNLALAGWLFLASLFWPRAHPATMLNEIGVALLLVVFTFRQPAPSAPAPIVAPRARTPRRRRRR